MIGKMTVGQHGKKNADKFALLSRAILNQGKSFIKYIYYKKNGHEIDFCWDPENKNLKNNEDQKTQNSSYGEKST